MADPVYKRNQLTKAVLLLQIPYADLILLRIEILLTARPRRSPFDQFERRPVNAVIRRQSGGKQKPEQETRPAGSLKKFRQNIRRIRPVIAPKKIADRWSCQLGEIFGQFELRVTPGEVRIRLAEP